MSREAFEKWAADQIFLIKAGDDYINVKQMAWEAWQAALESHAAQPQALKDHKSDLIFAGYTNGHQLRYAKDESGFFYPSTDHDCHIPLYMLGIHAHRVETTSRGAVTIKDLLAAAQSQDSHHEQ